MTRPQTLGELRATGHRPRTVKDEMRCNLLDRLRRREALFPGLIGYEDTVIPELVHALLARHDVLLLGLRGQGKTRLLRSLVGLLDESIPIVAGSELRDDPLAPISGYARRLIEERGDDTPIDWLPRVDRYSEKLATPDVSIADLFGDIDLVKHVQGRPLADEGTMHFGLIPRANRGIFCLNELPDLAPRIQVGLFNLLQERDVQIRGWPIRFPLDLCVVFSANPEDYTSRGRIVTPLKDRLGSVVRTHYPTTRAEGIAIVRENAWLSRTSVSVYLPPFMLDIVEEVARQARASPRIDQQSGVSARLSIAGSELLVSSAERRAVLRGQPVAVVRPFDLEALAAAVRGKIEPALPEDDEESLIAELIAGAIGAVFREFGDLPHLPEVIRWFRQGNSVTVDDDFTVADDSPLSLIGVEILSRLGAIPAGAKPGALTASVELILAALHQAGQLQRQRLGGTIIFGAGGR